jgi:hypothetical protein
VADESSDDKVIVLNVNQPGYQARVDALTYNTMKQAYLQVLPKDPPGLTDVEARAALSPLLPDDLFQGGKTAGWWMKSVQLDLEARGEMARADTKPLRFYRIA